MAARWTLRQDLSTDLKAPRLIPSCRLLLADAAESAIENHHQFVRRRLLATFRTVCPTAPCASHNRRKQQSGRLARPWSQLPLVEWRSKYRNLMQHERMANCSGRCATLALKSKVSTLSLAPGSGNLIVRRRRGNNNNNNGASKTSTIPWRGRTFACRARADQRRPGVRETR